LLLEWPMTKQLM